MKLPYAEPHTPIEAGEPVVPEPPRRGEPGGEPCGVCDGTHHRPGLGRRALDAPPAAAAAACRARCGWRRRSTSDSFGDLSPEAQAAFGRRAPGSSRADGARRRRRVHLYRWGDGGAHFHVWFMPRPLRDGRSRGMMLPLWEDVLPNVTDDECRSLAEKVAAVLESGLT